MSETKLPPLAFTLKFDRRVHTLRTPVEVSVPYLPDWGVPEPKLHTLSAIWDTGATRTAISVEAAASIGLPVIGPTIQYTANGERQGYRHLANVYLPNKVLFPSVEVVDAVMEADLLISMDIIGHGDFAITHKYGKTVMSFQVPAHTQIDFVHSIRQRGKMPPANRTKRRRRK